MHLWRLYRRAHGPGLDGVGGLHTAGRWHELGTPVVYFGATPAVVVLEKLAHIDPAMLPSDLVLAHFEGDVSAETWIDFSNLADLKLTRGGGDAFLENKVACVLRVPSVVLPEEMNLIFNPLHPDAGKIQLVSDRPFTFDGRLL